MSLRVIELDFFENINVYIQKIINSVLKYIYVCVYTYKIYVFNKYITITKSIYIREIYNYGKVKPDKNIISFIISYLLLK